MKKMTTPARLVVTRTPEINALLQEAWAISPELKEKITLTVHQAIVALVRERRRYQAFTSESFGSDPGWDTESVVGESVERSEFSVAEEARPRASECEPHPDSIWND